MDSSWQMDGLDGPALRRTVVGDGGLEPLAFAFWSVRPDVVVDNVARYAAETGERIACIEIPGDYERTLDRQFSAGKGPDAFYAQRAEASLWDAAHHVLQLDEADDTIAANLRRMDPRLVAGARNADGRLLGLTYYNGGPFALFAHRDFADAIDFDGLETWNAVLERLRRLRRDGRSANPFLPRWHGSQTGLVWSLLCHLASEGVVDFGDPRAPAALHDALGFLQALVDEELVPAEALADTGDRAALDRWAGGRHALAFTMDYLAMDAAEAAGRPIGIPAPRLPGRTGTPLMPGHAMLCLKKGLAGERLERAMRLLACLGGAAPDGTLRVHARWLADHLFAVPYPELDGRADIRAAMARWFPVGMADICVERMIAARRLACVSPPTHRPRFLEWSGFCDLLIRNDLLQAKTISAAGAADSLLDRWFALAARDQ